MANRIGRPPSKNPKKNDVRIRMTDEEVSMLNECSEKTGLSKADVIRKGIKMVHDQLQKMK